MSQIVVTFLCLFAAGCSGFSDIHIGVIFDESETEITRSITRFAVDRINSDPKILPRHRLQIITNTTRTRSPFHSIQTVCDFINQGVSVIIGPATSSDVKASHPMCVGLHVPMVTPTASDPKLSDKDAYKYLLRMSPSDSMQSKALVEFIQYFRYDSMAILTDDSDYGINGLMEFQQRAAKRNWRILSFSRFKATRNASRVDARKQLQNIKATGARVIVLNCLDAHGVHVLKQAHNEGMVQSGWMWVVTDAITTTNEFMKAMLTTDRYLKGILGTRPVARNGQLYDNFLNAWQTADPTIYPGAGLNSTPVNTEGVMKRLHFHSDGSPLEVAYDYVILDDQGWTPFGLWGSPDRFNLNITARATLGNTQLGDVRDHVGDLVNKSLRVATILEAPFVMLKPPPRNGSSERACSGNNCYYGLVIDLLNRLAKDLKFTYTLYLVPDGLYGIKSGVSEEWSGVIGELRADLGVGAITISYDRQNIVSFTTPFLDLELSIAIGLPNTGFNPYSFLDPLTTELWLYVLTTGIIVSLVVATSETLSPFGHHGRKVQLGFFDPDDDVMDTNEDGEVDEWEIFHWNKEKHVHSLFNSFFWTAGCYLQQGVNPHPDSWSGRVAASAWWFGTLIITATYTANLAAFLTIKSSPETIHSIDDLMRRTDIKYSTVNDSQPHLFFDTAERYPYRQIGDNMRKEGLYFSNTAEAIAYTDQQNGSFAFLYDLPVLNYWKGQRCRLQVVENGFAGVGYGFPLPKGSIYAEELSIKILQYRESGFIDILDNKWLYQTANCSKTATKPGVSETQEVQMDALWGIFWIIYIGTGVGLVVLMLEWVTASFKPNSQNILVNLKTSIVRKLRTLRYDLPRNWFYCRCGPDPRPAHQQ
ncbi:glutamate receptor ionotropic, kainate 2-like [Tubulanus polymorphus]|uniref:glutamate receptor ionotropic, kainate 2-like n=1 Tax=Tubulanus polymorphus TaxID=672921 RepID=UPI003DA421FC